MKDVVRSIVSLDQLGRAYEEGPAQPFRKATGKPGARTIVVETEPTGQSIFGFGSSLTGTDLFHLLRMSPAKREEALRALYDPVAGAGWNVVRLPFGATDWEPVPDFFTYDDVPRGEKDWDLARFSIRRDVERGLFRVARRCREINPATTFVGSAWGIPAWMKDNDCLIHGRLDPACIDVYARYLAKTVAAYREEGIDLYAITVQNEPLTGHDRATPSARMTWWTQRDLALAVRREFDAAGLPTRLWIYDHNFDMSDFFVKPMLEDPVLRRAIDGVAFHGYGGDPCVMAELRRAHPGLNCYMTERTLDTARTMAVIVKQLRAGARSYLQWTSICDEYLGPHVYLGQPFFYGPRNGRPPKNTHFLQTRKEDPDALTQGASLGLFGIFSRYLRPGMVRVESDFGYGAGIASCAFTDPATGEIAVICVNPSPEEKPFTLRCGGGEADFVQPPESCAVYRFTPGAIASSEILRATEAEPPPAPAWDIAVEDIHFAGEAKAGAEILLSCTLRNVGSLPTPEGATAYCAFSEDGDNIVAIAHSPLPVLAPGASMELVSNVPVGQPYREGIEWIAEAGRHQIFARVTIGGCFAEEYTHNNVLAKEFTFA